MKRILIAVCILVVVIGYCIGYNSSKSIYKKGYNEGRNEGFKEGLTQSDIAYSSVWVDLWTRYCPPYKQLKDVPWDEFTIQEKMFLCAYGSSGNKMSISDMVEVITMFGPEQGSISWGLEE